MELSVVLIIAIGCVGFVMGYLAAVMRHGDTKVGTSSASHNSAMLEIALILREFVADSSEHGITDTKYYWQKIDAVVAQLQQ